MLLPLDWNVCPYPGHKARLCAGPRWQKHAFLKPTRWRLCVSRPFSHCHMSVCGPWQRRHGSVSHSSRVVSFMALTFNHSYYTWTACAVTHCDATIQQSDLIIYHPPGNAAHTCGCSLLFFARRFRLLRQRATVGLPRRGRRAHMLWRQSSRNPGQRNEEGQ